VPAEPATPAEPVAESAEHSAAAEKKGVVDVLFTSFIIQ
jgi:flagellar basal body-associated protein FliL